MENWNGESYNSGDIRHSKDKNCNGEGKNMISCCITNNFEILNGKFGSDTRGDFTFINKLGSGAIDYALAYEGIINKILDFNIAVEIISGHMLLLRYYG
jgi:hypothetical protein